jgi:hypothetical protein
VARVQEKAQIIPMAISKPPTIATTIDSATATMGFTRREALLIGTIQLLP